jgi:hypothetical protein
MYQKEIFPLKPEIQADGLLQNIAAVGSIPEGNF